MAMSELNDIQVDRRSVWPIVFWGLAMSFPMTVPIGIRLLSDNAIIPAPSWEQYYGSVIVRAIVGLTLGVGVFFREKGIPKGIRTTGTICSLLILGFMTILTLGSISIAQGYEHWPND